MGRDWELWERVEKRQRRHCAQEGSLFEGLRFCRPMHIFLIRWDTMVCEEQPLGL
jgi:hypothetical protein